jgi:hypothetical protein
MLGDVESLVRLITMSSLFSRLRTAIRTNGEAVQFPVVDAAGIAFAEEVFGFALPNILRRAYREIGNGGFGPGPIIGLPGGYKSSWGDLFQSWEELQRNAEYEDGWLPVIDWGCTQFSIVDCEDDFQMVSLYEGEFHSEDYSFEELLVHWLDGEFPELHTGGFYRLKGRR